MMDKLRLAGPASRCKQIQIVIGVRWTIEPSVVLHRVRTEHDTVADAKRQPYGDIAGNDSTDKEQREAYASKHDEHHRVEETESERHGVLVKDGGHKKHGEGCQRFIARHQNLVHVLVDVRVQPVVHYHVPRAIIRTVRRGIPPILQTTNSLSNLQTGHFYNSLEKFPENRPLVQFNKNLCSRDK